jgi:FMN phosphatase YigB (HAD superfamily)
MVRERSTSLKAVLFDLDDTLLYSDMERGFIHHYFAMLTDYARPLALPEKLMAALMTATEAIHRNQDRHMTNEQVFAAAFAPQLGKPWDELKRFFARFYQDCFPELRVHTKQHPDARQAVQVCLDVGYRVAIATNPLFPMQAIQHRLAWAGIGDMPFDLVTAYENMHSCKPFLAYYAEIAAMLHIAPAACLMVGNDVRRDIAPAQAAGMRTFLADEWLTNDDLQVVPDHRGTLSDFIEYVRVANSK